MNGRWSKQTFLFQPTRSSHDSWGFHIGPQFSVFLFDNTILMAISYTLPSLLVESHLPSHSFFHSLLLSISLPLYCPLWKSLIDRLGIDWICANLSGDSVDAPDNINSFSFFFTLFSSFVAYCMCVCVGVSVWNRFVRCSSLTKMVLSLTWKNFAPRGISFGKTKNPQYKEKNDNSKPDANNGAFYTHRMLKCWIENS